MQVHALSQTNTSNSNANDIKKLVNTDNSKFLKHPLIWI